MLQSDLLRFPWVAGAGGSSLSRSWPSTAYVLRSLAPGQSLRRNCVGSARWKTRLALEQSKSSPCKAPSVRAFLIPELFAIDVKKECRAEQACRKRKADSCLVEAVIVRNNGQALKSFV